MTRLDLLSLNYGWGMTMAQMGWKKYRKELVLFIGLAALPSSALATNKTIGLGSYEEARTRYRQHRASNKINDT